MIFENLLSSSRPPAAATTPAVPPYSAVMISIKEVTDQRRYEKCLRQWLEADEYRRWSSFRLAKRQDEWLAGRISAKMALAALRKKDADRDMSTVRIVNRDDGSPYVIADHGEDEPSVHISISHSNERAAALASPQRCGIDVQHRTEKLHKLRERFCSPKELRLMQTSRSNHCGNDDNLDLLNLLWTAKEAIRKAYSFRQVPGFLDLQLDQVERHRQWYILTFAHQATSFITWGCRLDDYGLALCFLPADDSGDCPHA